MCCRYDVFYDFCSVLLEVVQMGVSGAERELVNGGLMVCPFWGCVEERNRKQKVRDDRNCCRQPRQEATAAGHIPLPTMPLAQNRTAAFPRICFVSVSVFVIVFSDVFG